MSLICRKFEENETYEQQILAMAKLKTEKVVSRLLLPY